MIRKPAQRTSEILKTIAEQSSERSISVGEFVELLGDRSFALAILIFSIPNSLPIPGIPGFSTITGLPIAFFAFQLLLGKQVIWLPKKVAAKEFSEAKMAKILGKAVPFVEWIERFLRPRIPVVNSDIGERVIALFMLAACCILVLPIPGGNFLPGLAITLLALAILEKDGILALVAMFFTAAGIYFMLEIIGLVVTKTIDWFGSMF